MNSTHARVPTAYWRGGLPDHVLMQNLATHFKDEDGATAALLADLADVDERRLYLPAGYKSLAAYCVGELKRNPDAVAKRIHAARAARVFPAIFELVAAGRLCLSGVCLLAPHLTEANADELLAEAADKTYDETRRLIAERYRKRDARADSGNEHAARHVDVTNGEQATAPAGGGDFELTSETATPPGEFPLHVTLSQAEHDALRYARALLGHAVPSGDLRQVVGRALEALIRELERTKFGVGSRSRPRTSAGKGRYIPLPIRRAVFERDGGSCTFEGPTGHRCGSITRLEFDHAQPVACGGESTVENLRLRCRAHNQYEADLRFGRGHMDEQRHAGKERGAAKKQRKVAEVAAAKEEQARAAAAAQDAKAEEKRKQQAREGLDRDVVAALHQLGIPGVEARPTLARCAPNTGATYEDRLRQVLPLFARGRKVSFANHTIAGKRPT